MAENKLPIFFRYRILWHLLFWIVVFFIYWLNAAGFKGRYHQEFIMNLYLLPVRMFATYTLIYLILPLATRKKEFVLFGIIVAFHALLYGFLIYGTYYFVNPFPDFYDFSKQPLFNPAKILTKAVSDYVIPVIAAAIIIFKKWYADEQKNKRLAEEKMQAELNFLKAQIHPHFLFNTLNNLYALSLIKSDKTPDIVLKLSDLLDYMIYKSNDEFVPLNKELEIVEGYIELEKMRYSDRLNLSYQINGKTDKHQIAPLILLPFIENCFKHGASKDRINPSIEIQINIEPTFLILKVINSIPAEKEVSETESNGIGLSNVKRRLELIYPGRHVLNIKHEAEVFEVELKIIW
jgi:two-component system, LytTR family, sensor kinase